MASFPRPVSSMPGVFLHSPPRSYPLNLSLTMSPKLGLPCFWGMNTASFMQFASPSSCFSLQETNIFGSNNNGSEEGCPGLPVGILSCVPLLESPVVFPSCGLEPSGFWWMDTATVLLVASTWALGCELKVSPHCPDPKVLGGSCQSAPPCLWSGVHLAPLPDSLEKGTTTAKLLWICLRGSLAPPHGILCWDSVPNMRICRRFATSLSLTSGSRKLGT